VKNEEEELGIYKRRRLGIRSREGSKFFTDLDFDFFR